MSVAALFQPASHNDICFIWVKPLCYSLQQLSELDLAPWFSLSELNWWNQSSKLTQSVMPMFVSGPGPFPAPLRSSLMTESLLALRASHVIDQAANHYNWHFFFRLVGLNKSKLAVTRTCWLVQTTTIWQEGNRLSSLAIEHHLLAILQTPCMQLCFLFIALQKKSDKKQSCVFPCLEIVFICFRLQLFRAGNVFISWIKVLKLWDGINPADKNPLWTCLALGWKMLEVHYLLPEISFVSLSLSPDRLQIRLEVRANLRETALQTTPSVRGSSHSERLREVNRWKDLDKTCCDEVS